MAKILANSGKHSVTAIVRNEEHISDLKAASPAIQPLVLSLETDPVSAFAKAFTGKDVVVFAAGSGGKGGPQRIVTVDYEGALKIFDAIELVKGTKPRLIMVSAIDVRDRGVVPPHYVSTTPTLECCVF